MAGGLAGSVVCLLQVSSIFSVWTHVLRPDCLGFEVHLAQLPSTIHLLRLRQCFTECRSHAVCCYFMDCS